MATEQDKVNIGNLFTIRSLQLQMQAMEEALMRSNPSVHEVFVKVYSELKKNDAQLADYKKEMDKMRKE